VLPPLPERQALVPQGVPNAILQWPPGSALQARRWSTRKRQGATAPRRSSERPRQKPHERDIPLRVTCELSRRLPRDRVSLGSKTRVLAGSSTSAGRPTSTRFVPPTRRSRRLEPSAPDRHPDPTCKLHRPRRARRPLLLTYSVGPTFIEIVSAPGAWPRAPRSGQRQRRRLRQQQQRGRRRPCRSCCPWTSRSGIRPTSGRTTWLRSLPRPRSVSETSRGRSARRQTATTTAGAVTTTTTTVTAWHSGHDEPLGRLDNAMAVASRPSGATKVHA
jgi:hypothetical protein